MEYNLYRVGQGSYERAWVPNVLFAQRKNKKKLPSIFHPELGWDDIKTISIFRNLSAVVTHDLQHN